MAYKPFKMKGPSLTKMVKQAGAGSPMKLDETPAQQKLGRKAGKLKRADKPKKKANITKKISRKYGLDDPRPRPPQQPESGSVKGLTQFQYDLKPITSANNKQLGKIRGKVKDYFFKK
mgnify:CR=1 FL=1